jgi:hypothetical protein
MTATTMGANSPADDEITRAVEGRRRMLEARLALATDDGGKDSIIRDIEACGSLLRKLAVIWKART